MKQDGIAYDITGEGPPLLLINGIGAPRQSWQLQLDGLSSQFRCLTFDNPGIGESDPLAAGFGVADMADTAARLLRALGIGETHVLGASMGGAIAQELALNHPSLVKRVAIACSWAACDRYLERCFTIMRDMAASEGAQGPGWSVAVQKFVSLIAFAQSDFTERFEAIADVEEAVAEALANGREEKPETFVGQANACLRHDTRARLKGLSAPALILAGTADIFTPTYLSRELADGLADADFQTMEGCGHVMFYERPDEFNARVAAFLAA